MRKIETRERLTSLILEGYGIRYYNYSKAILIDKEGNEVAPINHNTAFNILHIKEAIAMKQTHFDKGLIINQYEFPTLMASIKAKEKRKAEKQQAQHAKEQLTEAIEYLRGFCYEGENFTVTADFINNVETILEYFDKQKESQIAKRNEIKNVGDLFRVNKTKIYELPLSNGYYLWLEKINRQNVIVELHNKNNEEFDTYITDLSNVHMHNTIQYLKREAMELIEELEEYEKQFKA